MTAPATPAMLHLLQYSAVEPIVVPPAVESGSLKL